MTLCCIADRQTNSPYPFRSESCPPLGTRWFPKSRTLELIIPLRSCLMRHAIVWRAALPLPLPSAKCRNDFTFCAALQAKRGFDALDLAPDDHFARDCETRLFAVFAMVLMRFVSMIVVVGVVVVVAAVMAVAVLLVLVLVLLLAAVAALACGGLFWLCCRTQYFPLRCC